MFRNLVADALFHHYIDRLPMQFVDVGNFFGSLAGKNFRHGLIALLITEPFSPSVLYAGIPASRNFQPTSRLMPAGKEKYSGTSQKRPTYKYSVLPWLPAPIRSAPAPLWGSCGRTSPGWAWIKSICCRTSSRMPALNSSSIVTIWRRLICPFSSTRCSIASKNSLPYHFSLFIYP